MVKTKCAVALAALLSGASALPWKGQPYRKRDDLPPAEERAQTVVDAFRTAWDGYYKYAFPNDELSPVTNGFSNSRYVALVFGHTILLTLNVQQCMGRLCRGRPQHRLGDAAERHCQSDH